MVRRARILVTREQAEPLASLLARGGADPIHVALVSRVATGARPPRPHADVVVVSSAFVANVVPDLARRIEGTRVIAVGDATAAALRQIGVPVAAVGHEGGAEAMALAAARSSEVLWHIGGETLAPPLAAALDGCAARVRRWQVYRVGVPSDAGRLLRDVLPVDVLTFASPSAAQAFCGLAVADGARIAVIGATTAAAAEACGLDVHAVAGQPGVEGLAAAALSLVTGRRSG